MRRRICVISAVCLTIALLFGDSLIVFAEEKGGRVSQEKMEKVFSSLQLQVVTEAEDRGTIECFDINSKGMIALAVKPSPKASVYVYNSNGDFQYGYKFKCSEGFCISWNGENLVLYLLRSDLNITVDSNGNCVSMTKVTHSLSSEERKSIYAKKRKSGENEYFLDSRLGPLASSYSRLISVDANGNQKVLYAARTEDISLLAMLLCFLIVAMKLIPYVIRSVREYNQF